MKSIREIHTLGKIITILLIFISCVSFSQQKIEYIVKVNRHYLVKQIMVRLPGELKYVKFKNHKEIKSIVKDSDVSKPIYKKYNLNRALSFIVPIAVISSSSYAINHVSQMDINGAVSYVIQGSLFLCIAGTPINYKTFREKSNILLLEAIKKINES